MTWEMVKNTIEMESVDIRTMHTMNAEEYRSYISEQLLYVDHHDVLRSHVAGYPIATTKKQLDILMETLGSLRHKLKDD